MKKERRVCLGAFAGAHGVKGEAKVKTFTAAPENVGVYGALESEDGARRFNLKIVRVLGPDLVLVRAPEIADREDAARLSGTRLYVDRSVLPPTGDDELYMEDLIGLFGFSQSGERLGRLAAFYNFGAGDLIEFEDPDRLRPLLVPYDGQAIAQLDFDAGKIVVADWVLEEEPEEQH